MDSEVAPVDGVHFYFRVRWELGAQPSFTKRDKPDVEKFIRARPPSALGGTGTVTAGPRSTTLSF